MQPVDGNSNEGKEREAARFRALPSVDRVMSQPALAHALSQLPHTVVVAAVRGEIAAARERLVKKEIAPPTVTQIADSAVQAALRMAEPSLRPVINATGVIIHTNLGRAPLSFAAVEAMQKAAGYSNLEYDLAAGERGSRYSHAVDALRAVTGCEDALVVNNNAAALVLVLATLGANKESIVSRGQLVEIGGGFRVPEIMAQSGSRLVEVGTTNRTYITDYENAITSDTVLLMRIHASNFRVIGFTTQPSIQELSTLAHKHDLYMVDDVGSGALLDTTRYGLVAEPLVQESLKSGADLVLFSGDKLLGGPQSGIIVGKREVVERLRKHPLARALRVDKLTLAALEATLLHYLKGRAEQEVPVWNMISATEDVIKARAERWSAALAKSGLASSIEAGRSAVGGGSLPGETLPTWLVAIQPSGDGQSAGHMAKQLRHASTPIIGRVDHGSLLLDPRTVSEDEEELLLQTVSACLALR